MASKYDKERYVYTVYPSKTKYDFMYGKFLVCVMPDEQEALRLGVKLLKVSEEELTVDEMHNGVISDFLLKKRTTYGYCTQFTATETTTQYVDLVFDYPWVGYLVPTRKDIIKEILKDLKNP